MTNKAIGAGGTPLPVRGEGAWSRTLVALAAVAIAASCNATPLPMPPSARVDTTRMSLVSTQSSTVTLRGAPGALEPGDFDLRVTGPLGITERRVRPDGSFVATLSGTLADELFLERIEDDRDRFLVAVRRAAAGGEAVEPVPMPADRDGDESPDAIDCAPDDASQGGRRCEPATCSPLPEACNGLDDDCDGLVDDDGACTCAAPLERCADACVDTGTDPDHCGGCDMPCASGETCDARACVPAGATCSTDADCAAGEACVGGFCAAI
ncbi:MAG: hypothetical protein IT379_25870 [Deltaproteobacteria bacterium]|nr:hypothetical protein [Deltaproteobacteria bacterium]